MPDFSTISQSPQIRAIVQNGLLEREFKDSLAPRIMFRGEAAPKDYPLNVGDSMTFTGVGLLPVDMTPLRPGQDPDPQTLQFEQWGVQLQQLGNTIDTPMPSSITAIASLFYRNCKQLGIQAGMTLNRKVRNKLYNAALSGHTVADGAQSGTTLRVKRLNGFTRARRPDLTTGSAVTFDTVTTGNPLPIVVFDNGSEVANTVVGFTPDNPGDEIGPGTLTLGTATTSVADRAYVLANDRTFLVRVSGGKKVDSLTSASLLSLSAVQAMVSHFQDNYVPEMPDGRFHCHLDPTGQQQIFQDNSWQRLMQSLPDGYYYREYAIGEMNGTVFYRNGECPQLNKVVTGASLAFSLKDDFAGELTANGTSTGIPVHRPLFIGQEAIFEYYQDLMALITEAGVTGRVGSASITNNGIEFPVDRVQIIIRSPQNRMQDLVSTSYKFIGDWAVRTDITSGDASRYKRVGVIETGA